MGFIINTKLSLKSVKLVKGGTFPDLEINCRLKFALRGGTGSLKLKHQSLTESIMSHSSRRVTAIQNLLNC
jgi:hypothetical protein